ncbi:prolyl oligopeptidase family serine peptidase [Ureibacillus sp. FSL K6-8385]|uniref:S9 family peptidase n=1 Tax=Ureibacillus terrenus TaxID=118246 RepID=A0A540V075_9BACL|nr:prolyl oligopeptidase family serine peptidase [Ureibacillus terrenus]MED3764858.1 prolyl oligopeptidase family serine peptidase [Ureibacillus terrenus]TQE90162.1 S9 family peptidase [Ureibacillus terrenus]
MKENGRIESIRKYPSPNPNVELDEIVYWSDGLRVKGLLARPIEKGIYEAMLYLRGGLQSVGMVRPARIAQFASNGFIVFAPYYRGNRGGEGRDEFGGDDRLDALHGIEVLKAMSGVDSVHLFGFSRGGLMALWTAILSKDIRSVVTWSGVSDLSELYQERVDLRRTLKRLIGGSPSKLPEIYAERSPIFEVDRIQAPVLIIHGTKDENVSIEQSYRLERALKEAGKDVETWYQADLAHHYPPHINRETVKAICKWMKDKGKTSTGNRF